MSVCKSSPQHSLECQNELQLPTSHLSTPVSENVYLLPENEKTTTSPLPENVDLRITMLPVNDTRNSPLPESINSRAHIHSENDKALSQHHENVNSSTG